MFRDDAWRRAAPDEASSWRDSRREEADREDRRGERDDRRGDRDDRRDREDRRDRVDRRDRDRREDREPRGPVRSQEEGKQSLLLKTVVTHSTSYSSSLI